MLGNDYSYLAIRKDADGYYVEQFQNEGANQGGMEKSLGKERLGSNEVYLRVKVEGPDALCRFSYSEDGGQFKEIGKAFCASRFCGVARSLEFFARQSPAIASAVGLTLIGLG